MSVDSWKIRKQPIGAARVLLLVAVLVGALVALGSLLDGQAAESTGESIAVLVLDGERIAIPPGPHDGPASMTCYSTGACTAAALLYTNVPLRGAVTRGAYVVPRLIEGAARQVGPESKPPIA